MDPIREGIIKATDEVSTLFQHVTRSFGFLPDGRELVTSVEGETGLQVTLSDRADEGWPPVSFQIPREAEFSHATMGTLTRVAGWSIPLAPESILDFLVAHNPQLPDPKKAGSRSAWKFRLSEKTNLQIAGTGRPVSGLWVTQTRKPEDLREAVRARARATRARWTRESSSGDQS